MGFDWACPACKKIHTYVGGLTTRATTNCPEKGTQYKIWQYKVVIKLPPLVVEKNILGETVRAPPIKRKRFHSKEYTRSLLRGVKVVLGFPDPHRKDMDIITDAQDIINGLTKFIDKNWSELRGKINGRT